MTTTNDMSWKIDYGSCCVIIPVYNDQLGLERTVKSIGGSDKSPHDVIVYDDGSETRLTAPESTHNIIMIRGEKNIGISHGLNILIDAAISRKFDFAALIDAGDECLEGRFEAQLQYARLHPEAVVIGGGAVIVPIEGGAEAIFQPPVNACEIERAFKRGYPFVHPTALFRLKFFGENRDIRYNTSIDASVDFDLLYRLFRKFPEGVQNLPKPLVRYIRSPHSIGVRRAGVQAREALRIRWRNRKGYDFDTLAGFLDIRLIIRALSPRLFFGFSATLKRAKRAFRRQ